ncbi:bacteriohemerythrin [Desulfovibrio ferrophilus]|uniref:Hemerythrin-like metal-binding protein n=1 Tax=Desulfovibrio ferrophilus TaxID=241368 RepID=A0A2Z6AW49_9BACT|nr:hemerythrin family protein [Desulfovibrio ferrophilus]BBD07406.1 hemerythrin-like metal-binding protein [Desulfovibrio ferrophilus]
MEGKQTLWKQKYLLEIDEIDEQHKGFFDLCMKQALLCDRARKGEAISVRNIIKAIFALRNYAFYHFHTEEGLIVKYRYPGVYGHLRKHDLFLQKLMEFSEELEGYIAHQDTEASESFLDLADRISAYATTWWGEHIVEVDKQYAQHIRSCKGRPSGGECS